MIELVAPVEGAVVSAAAPGEALAAGQAAVTLESMKMEVTVAAGRAGPRLDLHDPRRILCTVADEGSLLELRAGFGVGLVTSVARRGPPQPRRAVVGPF